MTAPLTPNEHLRLVAAAQLVFEMQANAAVTEPNCAELLTFLAKFRSQFATLVRGSEKISAVYHATPSNSLPA